MAYKERSRHVPSPLNLTPRSPPPLLYDLPSESPSTSSNPLAFSPKSPRSPPRTPRGRPIGLKSPTGPNFASNLNAGLKNVNSNTATVATYGLHHPQPINSSNQAYGLPTPSRSAAGTPTQEMDSFGALCRAWYFQQDAKAGTQIQEILRTLPPAQRATYTRLQAQIRSSYHTAVALRRDSEFNAHITSTRPGASLTLLHRQSPTSKGAKVERLERLQRFVSVWCTSGNVGTRPFFEGLFAVLRLQGLLEELGGAGPRRMEWEIDDAVFKESAGKEFMLEAVDILKGVLGFDESLPGQIRGDLSPSSETAVEEPLEPPPPIHDQASPPVSPRRKPPPPLPTRRHLDENRKSRPSLPTIVSASVIDRQRGQGRTATGDDGTMGPFSLPTPNEELHVVPPDDDIDDEEDTFADPHPNHAYGHPRRTSSPASPRVRPAVPPRKKKLGSQSSSGAGEDIVNRTRSHSDPFDDTHGHLVYGHGHSRKATQGSVGVAPGASPSLRPLLVPGNPNEGGSSISTGTTGESVLSTVGKTGGGITSSGSALKKTVPLPPEDFELDETRPRHAGTDPPTPAENLESDEEEGPFGEEQEFDGKKNGGYGLHFGGKRRGSESTGLGLLGTGHSTGHHMAKSYTVDNSTTKLHSTTRSQSERGVSRTTKPIHATSLSNPTTLSNPVTLSRPTTPDASLMLTSSVFATGGTIGAEQHLRTWVVPIYLSNPEIAKLLDVFPNSITRGSIPRFRSAVQSDKGKKKTKGTDATEVDLEAGPAAQEREYVRYGTGRMWIGDVLREEGWRGSMWDRFVGWWRRVFC